MDFDINVQMQSETLVHGIDFYISFQGSPNEQVRFGFVIVDAFLVRQVIECAIQLGPSGQGQLIFDVDRYSC